MRATSPRSRDAVVVVPGIMGSELVDAESGDVLWGLSKPSWYVSAWTSGASLRELRLSGPEREGRYGRVRATRLLRFPAFAPLLAGVEPYTKLLRGLRAVAAHADAVAEFPYDWRLPVAYNAGLLTDFAARHLDRWRAHPVQLAAQRTDPDRDRPARLVMVAHSMGGLLVAHLCRHGGLAEDVRAAVTMGTPFYGAPKAVQMLGVEAGAAVPLPGARARRLAVTLPGVYDLLPSYRCVTDGPSARRLTAADIANLGGDGELARESLSRPEGEFVVPELVQVVGAYQPTPQAVTLAAGTVAAHRHTLRPDGQREDTGGDGTVPRESAALPGVRPMPLAQSHGSLASAAEAVLIARDVLVDRRTGPWLGDAELGLAIPDVVQAGQPFQIGVTGADRPIDVTCAVFDLSSGQRVDTPTIRRRDGTLTATAQPLPPGLYQVRIEGGGASPVSQILMSTEPAEAET
jgi:hypothetical protein